MQGERNIEYLKGEMAASTITSLQQAIGKVLENEMQKLLMARGNDEFAFKVVDPAVPPRKPTWPQRPLVIAGSAVLGFLVSVVLILLRRDMGNRRAHEVAANDVSRSTNVRAA